MPSFLGNFWFDRRRKKALRADLPAFLRRYLEHPLPSYSGAPAGAPLLAVDFETNGLDPARDHLLSVGAIAVDAGAVHVGSGWHTLVASRRDLDATVVPVHGITHDMVTRGMAVEAALEVLFTRLRGRFLLAHHARIEAGFLSSILMKLYGVRIPFAAIDTLAIEQKIQERRAQPESVRLSDARKRYGLPAYANHHALTDALAAAELYLAQCAHHIGDVPVSRLLSFYP
jgi:DNA polymerase-3 subunit epsilon